MSDAKGFHPRREPLIWKTDIRRKALFHNHQPAVLGTSKRTSSESPLARNR